MGCKNTLAHLVCQREHGARVKGESSAESEARVRAAVHALGSGGARAGRRERAGHRGRRARTLSRAKRA